MPATSELNQVGKRESLMDILSVADARKTPISTAIPKSQKPTNMLFSWQADKYDEVNTAGVVMGKDVEDFEDASKNRGLLQNHCQKFWRKPAVNTEAEEISQVAGINDADPQGVRGASEFARAKAKKVIEIKRDVEARIVGTGDAQADNGSVPYQTRGLGSFISNSAQSYLPVPTAFRTPAAAIYTGAATSFTEDSLRALLQARWEATGMADGNLFGACGSDIKNRISDFSRYEPTVSNYTNVRRFSTGNLTRIESKVDVYSGDYGMVELHLHSFLPNQKTAYILDLDYVSLRVHTEARIKPLEDQGAGPRCLIETILGLCCHNPQAHARVSAS